MNDLQIIYLENTDITGWDFARLRSERRKPRFFWRKSGGKNVMLAYGGSVIGCCKKFTKDELLTVLNACRGRN